MPQTAQRLLSGATSRNSSINRLINSVREFTPVFRKILELCALIVPSAVARAVAISEILKPFSIYIAILRSCIRRSCRNKTRMAKINAAADATLKVRCSKSRKLGALRAIKRS